MQAAATFTMASVGASMRGSGTSETRMSRGPWMVVARMPGILAARPSQRSAPAARVTPPGQCVCVISHVSYRGSA